MSDIHVLRESRVIADFSPTGSGFRTLPGALRVMPQISRPVSVVSHFNAHHARISGPRKPSSPGKISERSFRGRMSRLVAYKRKLSARAVIKGSLVSEEGDAIPSAAYISVWALCGLWWMRSPGAAGSRPVFVGGLPSIANPKSLGGPAVGIRRDAVWPRNVIQESPR